MAVPDKLFCTPITALKKINLERLFVALGDELLIKLLVAGSAAVSSVADATREMGCASSDHGKNMELILGVAMRDLINQAERSCICALSNWVGIT